MKIKWLGNSSFLIKTSLAKKILIDPFTPLEFLNIDTSIDIFTLSKDFHNLALSNIINNSKSKIITKDELYIDDALRIKSYLSYSDTMNGAKRGENYIHLIEADNLKLCHLGYLGDMLNNELISLLNNIDILFLPIGGNLCLNGLDAYKLCKQLNPKFIIPMCYKCNNSDFYFNGPLDFISKAKNILNINSSELSTTDLNYCETTTLLMKY